MDNDAPKGAHCFFNGQYCKIGRSNKVFVHRNGEWVFTGGITVDDIARYIIKQDLLERTPTETGRKRKKGKYDYP